MKLRRLQYDKLRARGVEIEFESATVTYTCKCGQTFTRYRRSSFRETLRLHQQIRAHLAAEAVAELAAA